jgi:hypothetical protein
MQWNSIDLGVSLSQSCSIAIVEEEINKEAFLGLTAALVQPIFPKIGTRAQFLNRLAHLKLTLKVDFRSFVGLQLMSDNLLFS